MAGQAHDISIEEAKAKQWIQDVENEITQTDLLLQKVAAANKEMPGDNDTILDFIKKAGNSMETMWKGLARTCREANKIISTAVDAVAKGGTEIVDLIDNLTHKLG